MADDLLTASLPPVSWTTGPAPRGSGQEAASKENRTAEKSKKGKNQSPVKPGEAIEADEHEIDSFA